MLNYIAILFLSAPRLLFASDESCLHDHSVKFSKRSSVAHIALKIEDDGCSDSGYFLIKLAPELEKPLLAGQQYHISFAENKDLASWAAHSYAFGCLERSFDKIEIVKHGVVLTFSTLSIGRIQLLQKWGFTAALTAPLHEHEVQREMSCLPAPQEPEMELKRQKSESELPPASPIDKARRFLSLSFN